MMIPRKEALSIVQSLRVHAEKELDRQVRRTRSDAERKASTDLNSAVARGFVPYAQDRDGYPEWAFHLLRDVFPGLIQAERGRGEKVHYGRLDEIDIPDLFLPLMMFADFRALLRGAKKTQHAAELAWSTFQTAFDNFDFRDRRYKPGKSGAESIWEWAQGHIDEYEQRLPSRKELLRDIDQTISLVETQEKALARELKVNELSEPPFRD